MAGMALTALGLSPQEDAAYRALVTYPASTADELVQLLARSGDQPGPEDLRAALRSLERRGLAVAEVDGDRTRYTPTPPLLALGPLVAARQEEVRESEAEMAALAEVYRQVQPAPEGSPVEVVRGREAVRHRFLQIQLAARSEILGFQPVIGASAIVPVEDNPAEHQAMERGVRMRIVLDSAWFDRDDVAGLVGEAFASGQELTVVEDVPMQLVIADERVAMLPLPAHGAERVPGAAIVHEESMVAALVALFHAYREKGWQLTAASLESDRSGLLHAAPAEQEPDEVDRAILRLLHIGLTDVGIARHLGVGHRSVQRRVSRMMRLADARSRFQLGCHAVRAGWLLDPDESAQPEPVEP